MKEEFEKMVLAGKLSRQHVEPLVQLAMEDTVSTAVGAVAKSPPWTLYLGA